MRFPLKMGFTVLKCPLKTNHCIEVSLEDRFYCIGCWLNINLAIICQQYLTKDKRIFANKICSLEKRNEKNLIFF